MGLLGSLTQPVGASPLTEHDTNEQALQSRIAELTHKIETITAAGGAGPHAGLSTDARVHAKPRDSGALAALLPNARVVFFVRDPADGLWVRLISQL